MRYYQPKKHYRWHLGFVAWLLHRLTGAGLAAYLFLHLWVLSSLASSPERFDRLMNAFSHPIIKLMEIGLLGMVLYHGVNGVRIVLMDYGPMAEKGKHLVYLWLTAGVIAVLFAAGGGLMAWHVLAG